MKIAIIDIGSNSVRLALTAGGKTLYKRVETARLSEGLGISGKLTETAIIRTAKAVDGFKKQALRDGAEKVSSLRQRRFVRLRTVRNSSNIQKSAMV